MGSRRITPDLIERLVQAFRDDMSFAKAAIHAGCDPATSARAFKVGWPRKGFPPISQVLKDEQIAARAALQRDHAAKIAAQEKERDEARKQAVQSRAQEGQMVTLARTASLQAITVSSQLLGGARKLAGVVAKQLEAESQKAPADQMSPHGIVGLLDRITTISEKINRAAHQAMVMERLHLGQPTDIIAHVDQSDDDMTLEAAELRIKAAQQALESAQRTTRHLTVIEGGGGVDLAEEETG